MDDNAEAPLAPTPNAAAAEEEDADEDDAAAAASAISPHVAVGGRALMLLLLLPLPEDGAERLPSEPSAPADEDATDLTAPAGEEEAALGATPPDGTLDAAALLPPLALDAGAGADVLELFVAVTGALPAGPLPVEVAAAGVITGAGGASRVSSASYAARRGSVLGGRGHHDVSDVDCPPLDVRVRSRPHRPAEARMRCSQPIWEGDSLWLLFECAAAAVSLSSTAVLASLTTPAAARLNAATLASSSSASAISCLARFSTSEATVDRPRPRYWRASDVIAAALARALAAREAMACVRASSDVR